MATSRERLFKRRYYLALFPVAIVALLVGWQLGKPSATGVEAAMLLGMAGWLTILGLAFWGLPQRIRALEILLFVSLGGFFLLRLAFAFEHNAAEVSLMAELGEFAFWFPAWFGLIVLVFGINSGRRVGIGFFLAMLVVSAPYAPNVLASADAAQNVYILIQLFLSSAVVIALFTMFGGTLLQVSDVATSMTRMAHTDALTEIANRRAAMDRLTQEIARAHRYEGAFSVLLLDLDHFKDVNDRHGHEMGDRVLQAFAELVRDACRDADLAARWGGEEFLAILPETDAEDAHAMAMRIREAVAAASFYDVDALTVSIGVATFRPGDTLDDVVGRADRALYIAKEEGRDRVALDPSLLRS